jgi:hypothetical protein
MARGPLAGTSGPGKFSKRTDMALPSASYGEGVETASIQSGAPMAKTPDVRPQSRSEMGMAPSQISVTPLFAPSQRPDEPITAGIAMGAGPGPEALGINNMQPEDDTNFRATMLEYMPVLNYIAGLPSTSPETRKALRQLRDNL